MVLNSGPNVALFSNFCPGWPKNAKITLVSKMSSCPNVALCPNMCEYVQMSEYFLMSENSIISNSMNRMAAGGRREQRVIVIWY